MIQKLLTVAPSAEGYVSLITQQDKSWLPGRGGGSNQH
jgi:hypothetical protein